MNFSKCTAKTVAKTFLFWREFLNASCNSCRMFTVLHQRKSHGRSSIQLAKPSSRLLPSICMFTLSRSAGDEVIRSLDAEVRGHWKAQSESASYTPPLPTLIMIYKSSDGSTLPYLEVRSECPTPVRLPHPHRYPHSLSSSYFYSCILDSPSPHWLCTPPTIQGHLYACMYSWAGIKFKYVFYSQKSLIYS